MKPRVLVVDDLSPTREMLVEALAYLGYEASSAEDGATALELVSRFRPAAVCLDLWMCGMSGGDVLDRLTRDHPGLPVIMVTADPLIDTRHAMCARGAVGYLSKPFDLEQLGDVLGSALGRKHGCRAGGHKAQS
jgi:two-component system OmpR family response regulator